jgi:hypothetical protein
MNKNTRTVMMRKAKQEQENREGIRFSSYPFYFMPVSQSVCLTQHSTHRDILYISSIYNYTLCICGLVASRAKLYII